MQAVLRKKISGREVTNLEVTRIKEFRQFKRLSQREMAGQLQIPQNTLSQYETGARKVPHEVLEKLAKMGVNLHWLATGEGSMLRGPDQIVYPIGIPSPESVGSAAVTPADLEEADRWVEELILKGRKDYRLSDRWGWIHLVSEEIAEARALGRPQLAREKVERLVKLARGLATL